MQAEEVGFPDQC